MPTDPYVPTRLDEEPRNEPNLAPGVHLPPAGKWRAQRPGDLPAAQPRGALFGSPGPNIGYALTLANRARDRLHLEPHERARDAVDVVAAIAMKRAALFGRAPVIGDVELAMEILGYTGDAPEDLRRWRPRVVREASHAYAVRRALVDSVDASVLRLRPAELSGHLGALRAAMAQAAAVAEAEDVGDTADDRGGAAFGAPAPGAPAPGVPAPGA